MLYIRSSSRTLFSLLSKCSYGTSAFDKKSIQFISKPLKQQIQHKDVVFYQAPPGVKKTFMWMYVSAGVQLLFWGNLSSLAYVAYSDDDDTEDAPAQLASETKRIAIAGGLVTVGIAISSLMCLYPWRYIDKLVLLKGGQTVQLVTHAKLFKSHQFKLYPIDQLYCKQKVYTGVGKHGTDAIRASNSHIFLRANNEKIAYMLDRKGSFYDVKVFDGLWFSK